MYEPVNFTNYATYKIQTSAKPCLSPEHQKLFQTDLTDIYKEFKFQFALLIIKCTSYY